MLVRVLPHALPLPDWSSQILEKLVPGTYNVCSVTAAVAVHEKLVAGTTMRVFLLL